MKKLTFLLLLLYCSLLHAQLENVKVDKIPTISQLPTSALSYIYQDSDGYMWYGTVDGLCRDDGYNVHVFRSDYLTPGIMDINSVLCIAEDEAKRIWFGTQKGAYILDKKTYKIAKVRYKALQEYPVDMLFVRKNGDIWIACQNDLYELSAQGVLRQRYHLGAPCSLLYEDAHEMLFYSTCHGYFYCKNKRQKPVLLSRQMSVKGMEEDVLEKGYWIVMGDNRIWFYRPSASGKMPLLEQQQTLSTFNGTGLREIVQDSQYHCLWIMGREHVYVFKPVGGGKLEQLSTQSLLPAEKKILAHLYKDRSGNIWVSSFDHYSFIVSFHSRLVRSYSIEPMLRATGFNPSIVTLCRDDGGVFWYYQEFCGLYIYDPSSGALPIDYRSCPAVSHESLYTIPYLIKAHQPNAVWVMTPNTVVMKLRRENMQIKLEKKLDLATVSKTSGNIEVIFEDKDQNLWIGTMNGVFKYDALRNKLIRISEKIGDVSDFAQSTTGDIWCTVRNKGICKLTSSGQWKLYPYVKDFLTLDITTDGTIWTSTGEGQLLAFAQENLSQYKDYTNQVGLNGDMVDHVQVDRFNHVWVVTPKTIREFNPKNGAVRVYSTQDSDIPLHRFLPRAVYCDSNTGNMFFGGIPGILSFDTNLQLESTPKSIEPIVTDVKVMGKSVWLDPQRKKSSNSIDIKPNEQNISIEFSTLDFTNQSHICYAYRLKGVDKHWVYLPVGVNVATYNHLEKGDYTFEVKATDENGLWSKKIATFKIHRLPAWWETWWAYTIYLCICIVILWLVIKRYQERLAKQNDKIIEENINESKKEYFTNVSQEMVAPLQTINAIADNMATSDKNAKQKLSMIQENVDRLQVMMQKEMNSQLSITKIDEHFIAKATKLVEEHLGSEKLDVMFVASELGMSRSTFSRKLKAVSKQTPLEFIRNIKMKHAADMLRQKTATVQDVMLAVGYNDHKTFTQVFKDTYGMSPSEYQRENRNN